VIKVDLMGNLRSLFVSTVGASRRVDTMEDRLLPKFQPVV